MTGKLDTMQQGGSSDLEQEEQPALAGLALNLYMATIDLTLDLLIHLLAFLSHIGVASFSIGVS